MHAGRVAVVLDTTGARRNVREPDFCFLRQERAHRDTGQAIEGVPDLMIEILSPTNRRDQMPGGDTWGDYERFGVPAYWIVDPTTRTVTQYRHERARLREESRLVPGDVLASPLFPGITQTVAGLFANMRQS
jgi:Uma2 family endonuclease